MILKARRPQAVLSAHHPASLLHRGLLSSQADGPWLSCSDSVPANTGDTEGEFIQEYICQKDIGQQGLNSKAELKLKQKHSR